MKRLTKITFCLLCLFSYGVSYTATDTTPTPQNKSVKSKKSTKKRKKSKSKTQASKSTTPPVTTPTPSPIIKEEPKQKDITESLSKNKVEAKELADANYILGFKEGKSILEMNYELDFNALKKGMRDGYTNTVEENLYAQKTKALPVYVSMILDSTKVDDRKELITIVSYIIGVDYGKDAFTKFFPFAINSFSSGLKDGFNGNKPAIDLTQTKPLTTFYDKTTFLQQESSNNAQEFLATIQGTKDLTEGIKYKMVKQGVGESPTLDDSVVLIYTLKDTKGSIFAQSADVKGDTIKMQDLSKGAQLALLSLKKGEQSVFYIPTSLINKAVSKTPVKPLENKNEIVVFEVTLVSINKNGELPEKTQEVVKDDSNTTKNIPTPLKAQVPPTDNEKKQDD